MSGLRTDMRVLACICYKELGRADKNCDSCTAWPLAVAGRSTTANLCILLFSKALVQM